MPAPIVITPPALLPVRIDAVKNFGRITTSSDDALIESFIATATEQAELYTRRSLITRTLQVTLDRFPRNLAATPWWSGTIQGPVSLLQGYPDPIALPGGPIQSVTGITTYDGFDVATTVDPTIYQTDTVGGRIVLRQGQVWPVGLRYADAVQITYIAGYGDGSSNVPLSICTAIVMQAQTMYDSRVACEMCDGAKALLAPYRVLRI